jgi:hypothetical protein
MSRPRLARAARHGAARRHPDKIGILIKIVAKHVMNTLSALVAILTYGIALGVAGLMLALHERARRKSRHPAEEMPSGLAQGLHGRLRIDTGEELEVFLQKAGQ